jgi:GT2 family glycosyltransferase
MSVATVIPIHNGSEFIEEAIRSVFPPREPVDEIVVDDGSKDDGCGIAPGSHTRELAREFERPHGRFSLWARQSARDAGKRVDGPASAEREELRAFDVRIITASGARHPGKGGSLVGAGGQGQPERFTGL